MRSFPAVWRLMMTGLMTSALCCSVAYAKSIPTTPEKLLKEYEAQAKKKNPGFQGFSAETGRTFFLTEHKNKKGETESCSSCHTKNPTKTGMTKAKKSIEPIAISANKKRFTDQAKVEKWFKRNCNDVLDRVCTPQEKGDFISYMMTAK